MKKAFKLAGTVVLYNPDEKVILNMISYLNEVASLYVVDNSEKINTKLKRRVCSLSKKITYIANGHNFGIAHALNRGAKLAIRNGFSWLLTMDQDSYFSEGELEKLKNYIRTIHTTDIGIVSANHKVKFGRDNQIRDYESVVETMTSGNILNLDVYKKVGPFMEKLFIDSVDHEYCLRLNSEKYKVIVVKKAVLEHALGDRKRGRFVRLVNIIHLKNPFIYKTYNNHSFIRKYYIVRNRLFVSNMYKKNFPDYRKKMIKSVFDELLNVVVFEKDKIRKLRAMFTGYLDYKRGYIEKKEI